MFILFFPGLYNGGKDYEKSVFPIIIFFIVIIICCGCTDPSVENITILNLFAIVVAVMSANLGVALLIFALDLLFSVFALLSGAKEGKNSPVDSEIMIKELEKRVEAVNLWDK